MMTTFVRFLALTGTALFATGALAAYDLEAPRLQSVMSETAFTIGREARIRVQATDNQAGIVPSKATVEARGFDLYMVNVSGGSLETGITLDRVEQASATEFVLVLKVDSKVAPGKYALAKLTIADRANNEATYLRPNSWEKDAKKYRVEGERSEIAVFEFDVKDGRTPDDKMAPVMTNVQVNEGDHFVGEDFQVLVTATDDQAGLSEALEAADRLGLSADFENAKNGLELDLRLTKAVKVSATQLMLTIHAGTRLRPGYYHLSRLVLVDRANNSAVYSKPGSWTGRTTYEVGGKSTAIPVLTFLVVHR